LVDLQIDHGVINRLAHLALQLFARGPIENAVADATGLDFVNIPLLQPLIYLAQSTYFIGLTCRDNAALYKGILNNYITLYD
jgi:hypothetical protein